MGLEKSLIAIGKERRDIMKSSEFGIQAAAKRSAKT